MARRCAHDGDRHEQATTAVVRIEDLHKSFGDTDVLRGVNLEVRRGEVVVVLGPSGSGKSTMLRCVNLLETPTGGRIFFEDTEITAQEDRHQQGARPWWAWCSRASTCSRTSPPRRT